MTLNKQWFGRAGKLVTSLCILAAYSAPALANYDVKCMELLVKRSNTPNDAFKKFREEWKEPLLRPWNLSRPLSDVEFEAFMDAFHGLSFTATFRDGHTMGYDGKRESLILFAKRLQRSTLTQVQYNPSALEKLAHIYQDACVALGRDHCENYDTYSGWLAGEPRPFSDREEQALKWSTLFQVPARELAARYREMGSVETVTRFHARSLTARQTMAMYLLISTFGSSEGSRLFQSYVNNYLTAAFDRLYRLYRGEVSN